MEDICCEHEAQQNVTFIPKAYLKKGMVRKSS